MSLVWVGIVKFWEISIMIVLISNHLHIWAIILVIRMIIWATRMISPIILNHPRVIYRPGDNPVKMLKMDESYSFKSDTRGASRPEVRLRSPQYD